MCQQCPQHCSHANKLLKVLAQEMQPIGHQYQLCLNGTTKGGEVLTNIADSNSICETVTVPSLNSTLEREGGLLFGGQ